MYPVSRRVNSVRNDGPDLVEPISPKDVASGAQPSKDPSEPATPGLFDDPEEPVDGRGGTDVDPTTA
jgi:hypothetical protein